MDSLIRFGFNERIRGQVVRLDRSWLPLVTHHQRYGERDVPPTVRERMGELTAAGLLLASVDQEVEDVLLGIASADGIEGALKSSEVKTSRAIRWLARGLRRPRGGKS